MNFEEMFDVGTILVVEDDVLAGERMIETLAVLGHANVVLARNLKQANQIVSERKIDLALLDVKLAKGARTVELGRSLANSGARVVFLTDYDRIDMLQATLGFEFIEKPISLPRLKATLHRAIIRDSQRDEHANHI